MLWLKMVFDMKLDFDIRFRYLEFNYQWGDDQANKHIA